MTEVFETVSVVEIFCWKRYRVKKRGRKHVLSVSLGRIGDINKRSLGISQENLRKGVLIIRVG